MKRAALCFIAVIFIFLTSCNGNSDNKAELLGSYTKDDMVLNINNNKFMFGEDASKLLDYLGKPDEVSESLSCVYEGYDKVYKYDSVEVVTFPKGGMDILNEVLFYDGTYKFKGGVKVGSTKDEVIKSYGNKFLMDGDYMIYYMGKADDNNAPHLTFVLKDNMVVTIDFYSGCYFS